MPHSEVLRLPNGEALPLRTPVTSADEAGLKTGPHAGTTAQVEALSPRASTCALPHHRCHAATANTQEAR